MHIIINVWLNEVFILVQWLGIFLSICKTLETSVEFAQDFSFELIKLFLFNNCILNINRLRHRLLIASNKTWVGKCFLEIRNLLLKNLVFISQWSSLLFEVFLTFPKFLNIFILILNHLLKFLLITLLSLSTSNCWFSVLKTLSSFLIFDGIF